MDREGAGRTILAVDDKEENRRLVRKLLVNRGYRVIEAATGEEAIDIVRREEPDLILMDLRLRAGIDGIEATMRMKAMPTVAHIPIVAITASVIPDDLQRALDAGCSGFIRKPIDVDVFPGLVAQHIVDDSTSR